MTEPVSTFPARKTGAHHKAPGVLFAPRQIARIVDAYQQGASLRSIRDQLAQSGHPVGVSHQAISDILLGKTYRQQWERGGAPILPALRGRAPRKSTLSPELITRIRTAHQCRTPIAEILATFSISCWRLYKDVLGDEDKRDYRRRRTGISTRSFLGQKTQGK